MKDHSGSTAAQTTEGHDVPIARRDSGSTLQAAPKMLPSHPYKPLTLPASSLVWSFLRVGGSVGPRALHHPRSGSKARDKDDLWLAGSFCLFWANYTCSNLHQKPFGHYLVAVGASKKVVEVHYWTL